MILWILLIILVTIGTTAFVVFSLFSQVALRKAVVAENLEVIQDELADKKKILSELATASLGLVPASHLEALRVEIAAEEETLRTEKGRVTIIQAEMEAVDLRLRELEEIAKELENSGVEAAREVEMLRARERDLEAQNAKLQEHLDTSMIQLDKLSHDLAGTEGATESLMRTKEEMEKVQLQLKFYEEQIGLVNRKYLDLKKAYDALDIEYAQLYEKQSQG